MRIAALILFPLIIEICAFHLRRSTDLSQYRITFITNDDIDDRARNALSHIAEREDVPEEPVVIDVPNLAEEMEDTISEQ